MDSGTYNLLLADDDADDCIFFKEALVDLPINSSLTIVNDGVELMHLLNAIEENLPDILFLDLNMPRKPGYECLSEIKSSKKLQTLPVFIFSTAFDPGVVNLLYERGAHFYIRKPGEFSKLRDIIHTAISVTSHFKREQPVRERFVLNDMI